MSIESASTFSVIIKKKEIFSNVGALLQSLYRTHLYALTATAIRSSHFLSLFFKMTFSSLFIQRQSPMTVPADNGRNILWTVCRERVYGEDYLFIFVLNFVNF